MKKSIKQKNSSLRRLIKLTDLQQDRQREKERRHILTISGLSLGNITKDNTDMQRKKWHYEINLTAQTKWANFLKNMNYQNSFKNRKIAPNSPIVLKEIEFKVENLPRNKTQSPVSISGEFYQTFIEELILILQKLFHKIEKKGLFQNHYKKPT